jgi:hypothetical protein
MNKKTFLLCGALILFALGLVANVSALVITGVHVNNWYKNPSDGFMDFEDGVDGTLIASTISGVEFSTTLGYDWIYADIRTGVYNVNPYGTTAYECNGNFFAWLGPTADSGNITFTSGEATYLSCIVSTASGMTLDAYDASDTLIATSGWASGNTGTGDMTLLVVEAPAGKTISYVMVHDSGNYWLIDDIRTDAPGVPPESAPEFPLGEGLTFVISAALLAILLKRQKLHVRVK